MRELTLDEVKEVSGGSAAAVAADAANSVAAFSTVAALDGAEPVAMVGYALAGGLYLGAAIDLALF